MNWFEKISAYQDTPYYRKIERIKDYLPYPFQDEFKPTGGNRIYLDLVGEDKKVDMSGFSQMQDDDWVVIRFLRDMGFEVEPSLYLKGLAADGTERLVRIGKILHNRLKNISDEIKDTDREILEVKAPEQKQYYLDLKGDWERDLQRTREILTKYESSISRALIKKDVSSLQVVISQDPHDIAKMSTDRGWTSCMDLNKKDRARCADVMREVKSGGLAAYLIDRSDKNIEHPYARILLRRLQNYKGDSILQPEQFVYGTAVPEFKKTVEKWANEYNLKSPANTKYKLKGREYTDLRV